jgi:hypothetical protein
MANVLTSFLVGIGWSTDDFDRGTKHIESSLNGVKATTLGISAAILGVFGGVATAAINTANRVDSLALATQNLNTNKQFVSNLGGAMKLMGGDAADALTEVKSIEETLANFKLKGELGAIGELPFAGVQLDDLAKSQSASEFMSKLAEQIPKLTNPQKQVVQQSLGLSDATMKLMSGGSNEFEGLLQRAQDLTGGIEDLTKGSRELKLQFAELGLRLEGITNELTANTLPGLIGLSTWANKFVEEHREDISKVIDTVAEHPGSTAALGLGATSSVFGAILTKFGLSGIGGVASKAGVAGQIVGGATLGTDIVFDTLENHFPGLKSAESAIDQGARNMGLGKLVDFSDWLFNTEKGQSPSGNPQPGSTGGQSPSESGTSPGSLTNPSQYTPETMSTPYKDVSPASEEANDTLVRAIQSAKVNVANNVNLSVMLDGQAIDAKITEVTERANYSTIDDVRSSTAR